MMVLSERSKSRWSLWPTRSLQPCRTVSRLPRAPAMTSSRMTSWPRPPLQAAPIQWAASSAAPSVETGAAPMALTAPAAPRLQKILASPLPWMACPSKNTGWYPVSLHPCPAPPIPLFLPTQVSWSGHPSILLEPSLILPAESLQLQPRLPTPYCCWFHRILQCSNFLHGEGLLAAYTFWWGATTSVPCS